MAHLYPSWGQVYQEALDETEPSKILERVHAAEIAIYERWPQLDTSANAHELQAIDYAVKGLLRIKTETLKWPAIDALPPSKAATPWIPRRPLNFFKMER
jgi:hypothetical protein